MRQADYDTIPGLNYSGAKEILKSPAHYQAWLKAEDEESDALRLGRLVHLASLEPTKFDARVRVMPECDRRTKEGKAIYEAFMSTLREGEETIKQKEQEMVLAVAEAAQRGIKTIAVGEHAEKVEHIYTQKFGGTTIKGRPDLVLEFPDRTVVIDVKTTQDASPKAFAKDVSKFKYHLQAAWYMQLTGAKEFYFVAVEKQAPYAHAVYRLDDDAIEHGKTLMSAAVALFGECNLYQKWPAYPAAPQTLSLPKWAFTESMDA